MATRGRARELEINRFTADPEVVRLVEEAATVLSARPISDIVDSAGRQYVDLVMEGGGMLGIALVGYTHLLERVGIRFLGIGGTSAGAINALLLAALGTPAEAKSEKILAELCAKDLHEFVDGDSDARDFIDTMLGDKGSVTKGLKFVQVIDNLNRDLGLNPGENFRLWLVDLLRRHGVLTCADLDRRMATLPEGLRHRDGRPIDIEEAGSVVKLVSAEITTESKVVFPEMAARYFADPAAVSPAEFVRASMSIPFFFTPYRVSALPRSPGLAKRLWKGKSGIEVATAAQIPSEVTFVDGGVMSNFPIALFHDTTKVPAAPTLGVKLGLSNRANRVDGPLSLLGAIFNSARHCLDYDFITQNPDYSHLVRCIPVDDFNWLDFRMPEERKIALFKAGALAAAEFVAGFDWPEYRAIRARSLS